MHVLVACRPIYLSCFKLVRKNIESLSTGPWLKKRLETAGLKGGVPGPAHNMTNTLDDRNFALAILLVSF